MQITSAIALLACATAIAAQNITYNVISLVPDNETMAVMVDNQVYPLTTVSNVSSLLHMGSAPAPTTGYKYAILAKDNLANIVGQENFTRSVLSGNETLNEFYGRAWNSMNLTQLPTLMDPLPIINRINSKLHIDGEIPTIHIIGNQSEIDYIHNNSNTEIDVEGMTMTYISPSKVKSFSNVTFAVSGQSTRNLDKLSYKINLDKKDDLYDYRRFKLRAMGTDLSYMRESLAADIAASVGLPSNQFSYVRVFINDRAIGLFGLIENFKSPWVRNEFGKGKKKFKQGALFIADVNGRLNGTASTSTNATSGITADAAVLSALDVTNADAAAINITSIPDYANTQYPSDLSYFSDNATLYSAPFVLKEAPSTGEANYTRIMEFAKFLSEQSNDTAVVNDSVVPLWEQRIDVPSFLRGLAMEVMISNIDGYIGGANNFILYDDIQNERLVFSGQDFDLVMGTSVTETDLFRGGNYTQYPGLSTRPLTSRMLAVPQFKSQFDQLIRNMTTGLVNPDVMNPRINDLITFLNEDVAWDKSLPRVSTFAYQGVLSGNTTTADFPFLNGVNGPTYNKISIGLREWLTNRTNSLYEYFNQTSVAVPSSNATVA